MKRLRVGLNGFGRIGRAVTRIALLRNTFDVVAVNTRKTGPELMAYLLQYDSVYRHFEKQVDFDEKSLKIGDTVIRTLQCEDILSIPWSEQEVDLVVDATGAFTTKEDLQKHIRGTVKKVILTAPAKDDVPHIVLGVNDEGFDFAGTSVISNASCTTNCAAPLFKVLTTTFGVTSGFLTTDHAYTQTQSLLDDALKTPDRSRAAALNIVPSTTGAAKAVVKVIPELTGKIDGMAIRVPVASVSFTDISAVVNKNTTVEEVNAAFKSATDGAMQGYMVYETQQLVSSDYIASPFSCTFDANYTKVINGNFVKVFGWYDNEWGYSSRIVDLVERVSDYIG